VSEYGGIPEPLGIARDTVEDLSAKISMGLESDMVVTSAGVSRGDFDVVKVVLAQRGEIGFWTVNMRPGKPLAFGTLKSGGRDVPHLGLPGNPVSSMIAFELFGRAAIFTMLGRSDWQRPRTKAVSLDRMPMVDERRFYARCVLHDVGGKPAVSLTGSQSSGVLSGLARANALAVIPEGHGDVEPGDEVEVLLLGV
jgi:molybdopterin molybdotransferase